MNTVDFPNGIGTYLTDQAGAIGWRRRPAPARSDWLCGSY
jgi:hypothetical protein